MSLPTLTPALIAEGAATPGLELPTAAMLALPERAIQFGTGALLRGFIGSFVDDANRSGAFGGRIVAVGSTGSGREDAINEQGGLYTLIVRGIQGGEPVEHRRVIGSTSRALVASTNWDEVLACARNPDLEIIFSNTTEVGIVLDETDTFDAAPPLSFPGKLTRFLHERAATFQFASGKGVVVLPCELIESNGDRLREIVVALAERWQIGEPFMRWLRDEVTFCNTLVDRIVPGSPDVAEATRLEHSLGYTDALLTACEPYRLFAIEGDADLRARLPFATADSGVIVSPDIGPYRERKVRLLNGAHTIMVPAALLAGCETVYDAMENEAIASFVRRAIIDEIVPGLVADGSLEFARDVLDRFANPHIRHELFDITLQGTTKMKVRVVPSIVAYAAHFDRPPTTLAFGFAAWLQFMRGDLQEERRQAGRRVPEDPAGEKVRALWRSHSANPNAPEMMAQAVCGDITTWGTDLTSLPGFAELVADHLRRIERYGIVAAMESLSATAANV